MIKVQEICKKFDSEEVLSGINLEINKGDIIHIKGSNGSGKSTLLKIIAKLIQPNSGEIIYAENLNLGGLIENASFIENETIRFNLKFLASLKGNYDENRIKGLLNYFGLDFNEKKSMRKYSVGMRQKAGIVQAIMEDQNVILLDEPTRGLDDAAVNQFSKLIVQLHNEGKAILICAHDGVSMINFTERFLLENGRLYPSN